MFIYLFSEWFFVYKIWSTEIVQLLFADKWIMKMCYVHVIKAARNIKL